MSTTNPPRPANPFSEPTVVRSLPTVLDLIDAAAARNPDHPALVDPRGRCSYGELTDRSRRLAAQLERAAFGPGDVIALVGGKSISFVTAFLGILRAGAVVLPVDESLPVGRKAVMLREARARAQLVCVPSQVGELEPNVAASYRVDPVTCQVADLPPAPAPSSTTPPDDAPAYIFFTSGTTGTPKGILGWHRGLSHFAQWEARQFEIAPDDRVVQLANLSFDGMLNNLFLTLTSGASLYLPEDRPYERGAALLRWFEHQAITVVQTVPSVLSSWMRLADAPPTGFATVRIVGLAGEPLLGSLVDAWRTKFSATGARVFNLYGPTETTILKSYFEVPAQPDSWVQPIGRPISDTQILILGPGGRPCGPREMGEIVIRTPYSTLGYINASPEEARRFRPNPFRDDPTDLVYFTGDRGKRDPDGTLIIAGRLDDEIKIHGVRVQPAEVAGILANQPGVAAATVVPWQPANGEVCLVAYVVPRVGGDPVDVARDAGGDAPRVDEAGLRAALASLIPAVMIPALIIPLTDLPRLASGKIDRRALPDPASYAAPAREAPRTATETSVRRLWAEVLNVEAETLGIHDSFFHRGGHSLLLVQLAARIRTELGVELALRALLEAPTIAELAHKIESAAARTAALPAIRRVEDRDHYPLTLAQQRMVFLHDLDLDTGAYNMAMTLRLTGRVDRGLLERCVTELSRRHEVLRTRLRRDGDEVVQVIDPPAVVRVAEIDLRGQADGDDQAARHLRQLGAERFDLFAERPLRAALLRTVGDEVILGLATHHMWIDGWSWGLLMRDFERIWNQAVARPTTTTTTTTTATPLPDPAIRYVDFAVWERRALTDAALADSLAYWRRRFAAPLPQLALSTDRPRPAIQSYRGSRLSFQLSDELTAALVAVGARVGATLFMTLLAGFQVVLHRLSGDREIIIGTDAAGRLHPDLEQVVGFFVNALPLRLELDDRASFLDVVAGVRDEVLASHANQAVPFDRIVEEIAPVRDPSRTPLFQVMFRMPPPVTAGLELAGVTVQPVAPVFEPAKFDLTLMMRQDGRGLVGELEYNTDLFDPARIEQIHRKLAVLLTGAAAAPDQLVAAISLVTPEEQAVLPDLAAPIERPVQPLLLPVIRDVARTRGDAPAIRHAGRSWSYRALIEQVDAIAAALDRAGVTERTAVALHAPKSFGTIAAFLAILDRGAVVLPIDRALPARRKQVMLAEIRASVVVEIGEPGEHAEPLADDLVTLRIDPASAAVLDPPATGRPGIALQFPAGSAYIFFTSGSTGTPKAILGSHPSLSHFIRWETRELGFGPEDRLAQVTTLSFDAVLRDIFGPLTTGGVLCLPTAEQQADPDLLLRWIEAEGATIVHTVPSLVAAWLGVEPAWSASALGRLRVLCLAGEPLFGSLVDELRRSFPRCRCRLFNFYGPSETTMIKSFHEVPAQAPPGVQPLGRPLPNTQIAVLRDGDHAAGLGEVGEIVIRTPFAMLGYLNGSKADAARFAPNPWGQDPADLLYRTGDLGRRDPDGALVILGRKDEQLKIRGVRVSPAEVAGVLNAHPSIQSCFVTGAHRVPPEEPQLVAYVVFRAGAAAGVADLREFAAERLLPAMVPAQFIALDRIPLLPNGKVDRRALAGQLAQSAAPAPAAAEPMSATAHKVEEIWCAALQRERIGLDEDFFQIGGHSLLATMVLTRIRRAFEVEVPLRRMFGRPTIRALAGVIDELLPPERAGAMSPPVAPAAPVAARSAARTGADAALYVRQLQLGPMENFVYLIGPAAGDEVVVIDPAWDVDAIEQAALRDHRRIVAAVVSHSHDDHINGLLELLRRRDLPVYAHREELAFSPALRHLGSAVRPVRAGDEISVGHAHIKLLHTPGHTPGSLCVLCGDSLFSGDTAFVRGCGRCDLEGGDPEAMYRSITDVLLKLPDHTRLFPGHHYAERVSSTLADERRDNRFFQFGDLRDFIAYRMHAREARP